MALLLKRPNALIFPGGAPGFDPNHVASPKSGPGSMLSCVAQAKSCVEITTGIAATTVGSGGTTIDGVLGPVFKPNVGGAFHFANKPTALGLQYTLGVMFSLATVSATQMLVGNSLSGTGGVELRNSTPGLLVLNVNGGTNVTSAVTVAVNTPYFAAVTVNSSVSVSFVLVNLATGQIQSQTLTGQTLVSTGSGTWAVGDTPSSSNVVNGSIAAAMITLEYIGAARLLQWAKDPWSFWYPRKFDFLTMLAAPSGGAFTAVFRKTLSSAGSRIGDRQTQAA